ncbi:MAG TPA: Gfo/Idh/MocA family oxidoreductase [Candidatus Hydrogenedentes bacterium]|nr:Gfo/Idh/MocA family oxidoreductase [Candidatus Hydrogenedentota bacterium]
MNRRDFLRAGMSGLALTALGTAYTSGASAQKNVRIGMIGTGNRGGYLTGLLCKFPEVSIPAVCDLLPEAAGRAAETVEKSGRPRPEIHAGDEYAYRKLLSRDDLDAVVIATPWDWHAPMAVEAMRAGKRVGVEVPAAVSVAECWDLVRAEQEAGKSCMMLENWSFRDDNLAVLNMIRAGLLGGILHCQCAYAHYCAGYWAFDADGNDRWPAKFLEKYNRDQYPTHGLGPVLSWLDINCGDVFESLTATATASVGLNAYFRRKFGPDHPNATRRFAQGDIVTSVLRTRKGKTVVVTYDINLPRPYDNQWLVQGTLGVYSHEHNAVMIEGKTGDRHDWSPFDPWLEEYRHPWWKTMGAEALQHGHGGADYIEMRLFVNALVEDAPFPLDLIDGVTMSAVVGLSEQSIAAGGTPVPFPDFTGGAWETRKPTFGMVPR